MVLDSSMGHVWQFTRGETAANLQLSVQFVTFGFSKRILKKFPIGLTHTPARTTLTRARSSGPFFIRHPSGLAQAKLGIVQVVGSALVLLRPKNQVKLLKACSKGKVGVTKLSFAKASSPGSEQASPTGTEVQKQTKAPSKALPRSFPKAKQVKAKPKPKQTPSALRRGEAERSILTVLEV